MPSITDPSTVRDRLTIAQQTLDDLHDSACQLRAAVECSRRLIDESRDVVARTNERIRTPGSSLTVGSSDVPAESVADSQTIGG